MIPLKIRLLTLMVSVLSATLATATPAPNCSYYARHSVAMHIKNVKAHCGLSGSEWSPHHAIHRRWCLKADNYTVDATTVSRQQQLKACRRKLLMSQTWEEMDYRTRNKLTAALLETVKQDDIEALRVFESYGVDLRFEWKMTQGSLLYWAINSQSPRVIYYLIRRIGLDPNLTTNGGPNPLVNLLNAKKVNHRLLSYLLSNGLHPNHGGEDFSDGSLPLPVAVKRNDFQAVAILLKAGANPNLFDASSPLLTAIENGNDRIVNKLLQASANVNVGTNHLSCISIKKQALTGDLMPMDKAIKQGNPRMISMLKNKGALTASQCRDKY